MAERILDRPEDLAYQLMVANMQGRLKQKPRLNKVKMKEQTKSSLNDSLPLDWMAHPALPKTGSRFKQPRESAPTGKALPPPPLGKTIGHGLA